MPASGGVVPDVHVGRDGIEEFDLTRLESTDHFGAAGKTVQISRLEERGSGLIPSVSPLQHAQHFSQDPDSIV